MTLAAFVAGGVFAQEFGLSVGGGLMGEFGRIGSVSFDETLPVVGSVDYRTSLNQMIVGGFVFLDATFLEASVAFGGGPSMWGVTHSGLGASADETIGGSAFALNLSLLGKFPIELDDGLTLFPLAGIGYNIMMSTSIDGNDVRGDSLNSFRLQVGFGADIGLNDNMFVRASLLGWYGFAPRYFSVPIRNHESAHGGFGGALRVGVGIRLF